MSFGDTSNLIDLSSEDMEGSSKNAEVALKLNDKQDLCNGRMSLDVDNNPFDKVLKLARQPDDPFEMLSQKAQHYSIQCDIREENLLQIEENEDTKVQTAEVDTKSERPLLTLSNFSRYGSTSSNPISSVSSINSMQSPNLEFTSLSPIFASLTKEETSSEFNNAFITDNTISVGSESLLNNAFVTTSSLKSINEVHVEVDSPKAKGSALSSPCDSEEKQKKTESRSSLLKLSLANSTISPLPTSQSKNFEDSLNQSVLKEPSNITEKFTKLVESLSLKTSDDSCDDLMSLKPKWIDSENDTDNDLDMLKIPILEEIENAYKEKQMNSVDENLIAELEKKIKSLPIVNMTVGRNDVSIKNPSDLDDIKKKAGCRLLSRNNQEVTGLIQGLKEIIFECSNEEKKKEANALLETLSSIFHNKNGEVETIPELSQPQTIIRQATFNVDEVNTIDERTLQDEEIQQEKTCSSIEPPVSEVIQKIRHLFGSDKINVVQANLNTPSANSGNHTYIVVMSTPAPLIRQGSQTYSDIDNSSDLSAKTRRRSQSLSIHDKSVRLPIIRTTPSSPNKESKPTTHLTSKRRNSLNTHNLSSVRKPVCSQNKKENNNLASDIPDKKMLRRSMLSTHHETGMSNKVSSTLGKAEVNLKKIRIKSADPISKPQAPMKATIPVKRVAPMRVTTSVSSPIKDNKRGVSAVTSTPVVTNLPGKSYSKVFPNACSTPASSRLPEKNSLKIIPKARSRYSYISTTPNPKTNVGSSSQPNRRRSLTEIKSPKSTIESVKRTGITRVQVRSFKLPQDFCKTVNEYAPTKNTIKQLKTESHLDGNKENNHPKTSN